MYLCLHVCLPVCLAVCLLGCLSLCMHACMYVYNVYKKEETDTYTGTVDKVVF